MSPATGPSSSAATHSNSDSIETVIHTVDAAPASPDFTPTLSSASRPRSSSASGLDIELQNMRLQDPLYANGGPDLRNRSAWAPFKSEGWINSQDHAHSHHSMDRDREGEARRLGNKHFLNKLLINSLLIALWYILSIAMSVYNKWMFSPGNLDFHFPLFSTSVHMLVQFLLASTVLWLFPRFRPSRGSITDDHGDPEEASPPPPRQSQTPSKPVMTPWFYFTRIVTTGSVTGLDIGLGNTSLKHISLTFFTMVKSSTLGFVLAFAILFRLEAPSWRIGAIIAVMTIGVILMVSGETAFDVVGFLLLLSASFFAGLRWSLTQILLRRTAATSNPFSTLFFLTPVMFAVLFLIAIPTETFPHLAHGLDLLAQRQGLGLGLIIVLFPGCIAFCMTAAEFALLKRTSVVTLSVCGIFKEVLTITAAGIIFGDELTPINISGLVITLAAIAVYNWTRMARMKKHEISKASGKENGVEVSNLNANGTPRTGSMSRHNTDQAPLQGSQEPLRRSQDPFTIEDDADEVDPQGGDTAQDEEQAPMLRSAAKPGTNNHKDLDDDDDDDTPANSGAVAGQRRDGYKAL